MRINFPLNKKNTLLGVIPDPVIPVSVFTAQGYQLFDFLVDTGADCSIMPQSVAKDLDVNLAKLPRMHFCGIEGKNIVAYISKIVIKIADIPLEITCAFSSNERSPFILGRKDIFNKFSIYFDNRNKSILFHPIQ